MREIEVSHPATKAMIKLSRTQDEKVGDSTTSVTVVDVEILILWEHLLQGNIHSTVIVSALYFPWRAQ